MPVWRSVPILPGFPTRHPLAGFRQPPSSRQRVSASSGSRVAYDAEADAVGPGSNMPRQAGGVRHGGPTNGERVSIDLESTRSR